LTTIMRGCPAPAKVESPKVEKSKSQERPASCRPSDYYRHLRVLVVTACVHPSRNSPHLSVQTASKPDAALAADSENLWLVSTILKLTASRQRPCRPCARRRTLRPLLRLSKSLTLADGLSASRRGNESG
jgi:hypothetical protein